MKATSAIVGRTTIILRGVREDRLGSGLGIVIGKTAKYVSEAEALDYVAGYCTVHDVSERRFPDGRHGQWTKGNPATPLGRPDRGSSPKDRGERSAGSRNVAEGQRRDDAGRLDQDDGLRRRLSRLLSSAVHVAAPGDIISTGPAAGRRWAMKPPRYLKAGDIVALGIEGLGSQTQRFAPTPELLACFLRPIRLPTRTGSIKVAPVFSARPKRRAAL